MLTQVDFVDVLTMRSLPGTLDTIVVSMLEHSEEHMRPKFVGFADVLVLQFDDAQEISDTAHPLYEPWPDEPSALEHARFSSDHRGTVPALSDAQTIVGFLLKHHRAPAPLKLMVHCHGGISRSAAVASWAAVRFWAPLATSRSTDRANLRLMRLLDKANATF